MNGEKPAASGSVRQEAVDFEFSQHERVVATSADVDLAVGNGGHSKFYGVSCQVTIRRGL